MSSLGRAVSFRLVVVSGGRRDMCRGLSLALVKVTKFCQGPLLIRKKLLWALIVLMIAQPRLFVILVQVIKVHGLPPKSLFLEG